MSPAASRKKFEGNVYVDRQRYERVLSLFSACHKTDCEEVPWSGAIPDYRTPSKSAIPAIWSVFLAKINHSSSTTIRGLKKMGCRKRIRLALLLATCVVTGRTWAQLKPGIVVESIAKYSEGEKAGVQEGDVLLSWSRGDTKGEIESPFDLSNIEIEQVPRRNVTIDA